MLMTPQKTRSSRRFAEGESSTGAVPTDSWVASEEDHHESSESQDEEH
jgi:hypothetical protein